MHAIKTVRVELGSYKLKDATNVYYNQWEEGQSKDNEPVI